MTTTRERGADRGVLMAVTVGLCDGSVTPRRVDYLLLGVQTVLAEAGLAAERLMTHRVELPDGEVTAGSLTFAAHTLVPLSLVEHAIRRTTGVPAYTLAVSAAGRTSGPPGWHLAARIAARCAEKREEGRAVVFQGSTLLSGTMSVADVLARSEIDLVSVLARGPACVDERIDTRGFVRPVLRDGRLELLVQPAAGGVLVPFEVAAPTTPDPRSSRVS